MKKFKNVILILLFGFVSMLPAEKFDRNDYRIYQAENGKELTLKKLTKKLAKYDVIFFGEWHDDILLHQLEADILPLLDKKNDLAISMEMFERDVQEVVDDFLAGKLDEKEFLVKSHAWSNYPADYKLIVEYAKGKELDVIAANVPRKYAALINKQGSEALSSLSDNEKRFVAKELKVLDNEYKKQFMQTMAANMGRKNAMGMQKMLENIYAAQCLKDDTMAESIYEYLQKNKGRQVIHYNGNFHSESHLGTANKLHLLNPELKIAVITPVVVADGESLKFDANKKSLGDFLIFAHRFASSEEKKIKAPKMFKNVSNTILEHRLNLELDPAAKNLTGYDEITLSRELAANDTIYLLSAFKVKNIQVDNKPVKYKIINEKDDYQGIVFLKNFGYKKVKIEYSGNVYFPLKGRELNQTHDGTMGMISAADDEGIYLPERNWYPIMGDGLADFNIIVVCPNEFKLLTSGKETITEENGKTIYNWISELPVDNLCLVGNKFVVKSRTVNNVELRTYLLPEDAKFADIYLAKMEKYLLDYSILFGEYPFSSFSVVENFFASGFGMPNYTLLSKEIVKMPFITLSPGVIAHEFCHNWWGNSVYVDYENGNWCEALTVFSSNYYQNILNKDVDKAADWRKKAILENNLLPEEKRFALKDFVYQHNADEAVIGYQKGALLFVSLYHLLGEDLFFKIIKDFYQTNKGKVANWNDLKIVFNKHYPDNQKFPLEEIFDYWLNSTSLPHIYLNDVAYNDGKLTYCLIKKTSIPLQIPVRITLENGEKIDKTITLINDETKQTHLLKYKPAKIEIDPDCFILKKIPEQSMPYNLNRTLNDNPLVILPEKGEMVSRLQMVASMLTRSGYNIEIKSANEVSEEDLQKNSLFILGEFKNNSVLSEIDYPEGININDGIIEIDVNKVTSKKGSIMLSFGSGFNENKSISVYVWNSTEAITSFRKMFHYMNDSWQIFDLQKKEKGTINSGKIYSDGKNDLVHEF